MKAGILAGGTGSRFLDAGWKTPKPLIEVRGKPLIFHALENLFAAGVTEVEILLNGEKRFDPVETCLRQRPEAARIRILRRITASSFESFATLADSLGEPPFVITTVDAILPPEHLRAFLALESYPPACGLALAVTDLVHDENPLWVSLAEDGRVEALGDAVFPKRLVTAGLYLILGESGVPAPRRGYSALRHFLKRSVEQNVSIWGRLFPGVPDIDNPRDVELAESLPEPLDLKQTCQAVSL